MVEHFEVSTKRYPCLNTDTSSYKAHALGVHCLNYCTKSIHLQKTCYIPLKRYGGLVSGKFRITIFQWVQLEILNFELNMPNLVSKLVALKNGASPIKFEFLGRLRTAISDFLPIKGVIWGIKTYTRASRKNSNQESQYS